MEKNIYSMHCSFHTKEVRVLDETRLISSKEEISRFHI